MPDKFEINRTKIKGGCQSGRKVVTHDSKSNLPLASSSSQWWLLVNICRSVAVDLEIEAPGGAHQPHTAAELISDKRYFLKLDPTFSQG